MKKLVLICVLLTGCSRVHVVPSLPIPPGLTEASTGFDTLTNGFASQADMNDDQDQFIEEAIVPALGPAFNARSCGNCHNTPTIGASSQVFEHRVARGPATLIHDRSTDPEAQQVARFRDFTALRSSLSLMGDGFVEQVPDAELRALAAQNGGQFLNVPVLEMPGTTHVGRFGWKDQHASLLSFAGDADFNEKGVGNRFLPDPVNGIEDNDNPAPGKPEDIDFYAEFMRSLKAPSRGPITAQIQTGEQMFRKIGCTNCHTATLYTDQFQFHPFGDYLLHDIDTGDGIQQGLAPANKVRTAPLWGLRTRSRFLHDGRAFDIVSAINDHGHEAKRNRSAFFDLSREDKAAVLAFLRSL